MNLFFYLGLKLFINDANSNSSKSYACMIINGLTIISLSIDDCPVINDYI